MDEEPNSETAFQGEGQQNVQEPTAEELERHFEIQEDMLDKVPPDFSIAKQHKTASAVHRYDMRNIESAESCPCCEMPTTSIIPYNPCGKVDEMEALGSGFVLYFKLKGYTIIIFAIMSLIIAIYTLSSNTSAGKGNEWLDDPTNSPSYVVETSLGNHGVN